MRCYSANNWDLKTRKLIHGPPLTIGTNQKKFRNTWQRVPGDNDRRYRITGFDFAKHVKPGEGISWHFYVVGTGRQFRSNLTENLTYANIEVRNSRGIAFVDISNNSLTYSGIRLAPVAPQLAVGARDAFHLVCNDGDLLVEDTYIKGFRWDPFNIKSKFVEVTGITDPRNLTAIVRTAAKLPPLPGKHLVFWVGDRPVLAMVKAEEWMEFRKVGNQSVRDVRIELAGDLPDGVVVGAYFTPEAWVFDNAVIRRTTIEGNYGRALLYQGENLEVTDCTFANNAYANIALGPIGGGEGGFVRHAVIQGNRFIDSTWNDGGGLLRGTITLFQNFPAAFTNEPYNENIRISDNVFTGIDLAPNVAAINIANARDVEIAGNTFERCATDIHVNEASTKISAYSEL